MWLPHEFFTLMDGIWPMLVIFVVVLTIIRISYLLEKGKSFILYKEFFSLVFILYFLLLFGLVTNTDVQSFSNNFTPLKEILRYDFGSTYFIWNVIGNIAIFIPFGFIVSLILNSKKISKPLLITLITSVTIEFVQMEIGRSFDIDDIILNCIGGIVGYLLFIGLSAIRKHLPLFLQRDSVYNLLTIVLIIIVLLSVFNLWGLVR